MEKYEKATLEKFKNFDVTSKEKAIESFKSLWRNEKSFETHIIRRVKKGHIKNRIDYLEKTLKCLAHSKKVSIAIYNSESWDNLYYEAEYKNWAVIFNENGELMTSYKVETDGQSFFEVHKNADKIVKGAENGLYEIFKKLYNRYRNNTNR